MKKKIIAIILAVILILGAIVLISGCSKDEGGETTTNPTFENVPSDKENGNADEIVPENTDKNEPVKPDENSGEKPSEQSKPSEGLTEENTSQATSPTKPDSSAICDVCGGTIVSDKGNGEISVGNYCDGKCDEWFGELEL